MVQSTEVNRKPLTDWDVLWTKCEEAFFHLPPYCSELIWFMWISLDRTVDGKGVACPVATDQLPLQQPRPYRHANSQVLFLTV